MQGRERVTLQKTTSVPECELAPFHHLQGVSHKEHHEYLRKFPKPEVRDLVKEREWRLRNGHVSPSRTLTVVEDVTRVEAVFAERRALAGAAPAGAGPALPFSAEIPRGAPSSFYVAGGNWSVGKGYLAEIVYTVSAAVVGAKTNALSKSAVDEGEDEESPDSPDPRPAGDAPPLALLESEAVIGSAKRHFLVTQSQYSDHGVVAGHPDASHAASSSSSPRMTASRRFLAGGEFRATASLDRAAVAPGADVAVVKTEVNNTGSVACAGVTVSATCSLSVRAGVEFFTKNFELAPTFHRGFAAGHFGERFHAFPTPPGWPATTAGALVRCGYGVRVLFELPAPNRNLTLDLPLTVTPTASMYSAARPAGAPFVPGPETAAPAAASVSLPPARLFRAPCGRRRVPGVLRVPCAFHALQPAAPLPPLRVRLLQEVRGREGALALLGFGVRRSAPPRLRGGGARRRRLRARGGERRVRRRRGGRRRAERGRVRPRSRDHDRERRVRNRRRLRESAGERARAAQTRGTSRGF